MEGQYYRAVALDDKGTKEPVNYLGVHPLIWRDRPDIPEMGFTEVYDIEVYPKGFVAWLFELVNDEFDRFETIPEALDYWEKNDDLH